MSKTKVAESSKESIKDEHAEKWIKLKDCSWAYISNIILHDRSLIMAPSHFAGHQHGGIRKYNQFKDEWEILVTYPNTTELKTSNHSIAIDSAKNRLYIYNKSSFITCDLKNKVFEQTRNAEDLSCYYEPDPYIFMINSKIHILLNSKKLQKPQHLIYNEKADLFETIHIFDYKRKEDGTNGKFQYSLVYVPSKNKVLMFGGYAETKFNYSDGSTTYFGADLIYEYNVENRKWKLLSVRMPEKVRRCRAILTRNEKYIILICQPAKSNSKTYGNIHILHLNAENEDGIKFSESKIKTPVPGGNNTYYGCMTNDEIIVNGWIRKYEQNNHHKLPNDIKEMVWIWYGEYVHLCRQDVGTHYKIDIHTIIPYYK